MLSYLKAFTFFLLWALIAFTTHHYISSGYLDHCNLENVPPSESKVIHNYKFFITDAANDTISEFSNGFEITKNSALISSCTTIPYLKDSIFKHLANNYTKELYITGKLNETEANQPNSKNLGVERAKELKKELVTLGLETSKIKIFSKTYPFSFNKNNSYWNGIDLKLNTIKQTVIDSIENNIRNKTLYIDFEKENLEISKNIANYTLLLKQYLVKNSDKKIEIIGHTDNIGYFENNYIIGLDRANKLKEFFISKNIDPIKNKTSSKGESEPIADKRTEEGRAKNKRIQILIN